MDDDDRGAPARWARCVALARRMTTGDVGRRVLIIGINYTPERSGNAPYTTGLAEHLAARGDRVTVLTGMPHYPAWRVDPAYAGRIATTETRNGVCILRRATYVPARQSAIRRAAYEGGFVLTGFPLRSVEPPDAILGIVPGLSGAVLARLLAARYRTRYGLLFQDLMGQAAAQSGISGGGRVARATRVIERWAVSQARAVAAVSPAFFPYLRGVGVPASRLHVVPNWTHVRSPDRSPESRAASRARLGWTADETIVLHAGNMGSKQHLDQVLDAAAVARATLPAVRFVLLGDGNRRADLESAAHAAGLANISFLPPEPDETYVQTLAASDILLVTERASVVDMALPSKLTSYAVAGRPVIAAVNPLGATAAEVARSGNGLVVAPEEPGALLAAIARLRADTALANHLAAAGPAYAASALGAPDALARGERLIAAIAETARKRSTRRAEVTA
jgi:colanic acid biosynthesis glycosyl transferase WcaI